MNGVLRHFTPRTADEKVSWKVLEKLTLLANKTKSAQIRTDLLRYCSCTQSPVGESHRGRTNGVREVALSLDQIDRHPR